MYVVYCQNKPKSEHIVSEYIETFFEVSLNVFLNRADRSSVCASRCCGNRRARLRNLKLSMIGGPERLKGGQATTLNSRLDKTCISGCFFFPITWMKM